MRVSIVLRYVGLVLLINALFMLIAGLISLMYGGDGFGALLYSAVVTALFGVFPLIFVPTPNRISNNEGLAIVVSGWILSCVVGMIPYILWGGEFTIANAWFESVSGYTTTGSTILIDIEAIPHGILFWRAITHWLGGMGIIMFVLAVLPSLGTAGMILYRNEMSPVAMENFKVNARTTMRIVLGVYVGLTILETAALVIAGMNLFDAVTHSFATIATGGFSPKNASVAYYDSVTIETIILFFMVISGLHFGLIFSFIFERSMNIFKSTIVRYYVLAMVIGTAIVTINVHGTNYDSWGDSLRFAAFQIASVGTSTGFANADSAVWPALSQILLMFFALQCATAGSTSGGIKADRIVMFGKAVIKQIKLLRHPRAIITVKLDNKKLHDDDLSLGVLYICLYIVVVAISGLLVVMLGVDAVEAFSGAIATMGNVGPGLGGVGSVGNFSQIPALGKWIFSGDMLLGRLEIYGMLIFFLPSLWKEKSTVR